MSPRPLAKIHSISVSVPTLSMSSVSTRCCPALVPIGELPILSANYLHYSLLVRLQTGMRGAWGKPYGTVARVNIGQVILSIRTKENNAPVVMEALRRARYKFPGRQKIIVSKKWGFTNVNKEEYLKLKEEKKVLQSVSQFIFKHSSPNIFLPGMVPTFNSSVRRVPSSRTSAIS